MRYALIFIFYLIGLNISLAQSIEEYESLSNNIDFLISHLGNSKVKLTEDSLKIILHSGVGISEQETTLNKYIEAAIKAANGYTTTFYPEFKPIFLQTLYGIQNNIRTEIKLVAINNIINSLQEEIKTFDSLNKKNISYSDLLMQTYIKIHDKNEVIPSLINNAEEIDSRTQFYEIHSGGSIYQNSFVGINVKVTWKRLFKPKENNQGKLSILSSFNFRSNIQESETTEKPKAFGSIGVIYPVPFLNLRKKGSAVSAGFLVNTYYKNNILDLTTFQLLASNRNLMFGLSWSHLTGFGTSFLIGID